MPYLVAGSETFHGAYFEEIAIASVTFVINLFNMIPIPPLDGFGGLGLFTSSEGQLRLQKLRMQLRGPWMLAGILLASRVLGYVYDPLLDRGVRAIYGFYRG